YDKIRYTMSIKDPKTHMIEVNIDIPEHNESPIRLSMSAWSLGAYLISDYARNVEKITATTPDNTVLKCEKADKHTWLIHLPKRTPVSVNYSVYAFELDDNTSYVEDEFAIINPGTVLLAVEPYIKSMNEIVVEMPASWNRISTGMRCVDNEKWIYESHDYDELIDCPMLLGNHIFREFSVKGIPHEVAIEGRGNLDVDKFIGDIEKITAAEIDMMKDIPYERYVFLLLLTDKDAGLEHMNSTLIFVKRLDWQPREKYIETISIFSHELFHAWNVKALRPKDLVTPDYYTETYTDLLWVSEGFTNYYQDIFLLRSGVITSKEYFKRLGNVIHRYLNTPGRFFQSAAQSSFDTWIKYYKPDENTNNSSISYYLKGSLIALLLNLRIIRDSGGVYSLDDLVRQLYIEKHVKDNSGFSYEDIVRIAEYLTGSDLIEFINQLVYGTGDLPFEMYFKAFGLDIEPVFNENQDQEELQSGAHLGCRLQEKNSSVWITSVERNGPAMKGGLQSGDELIACNGFRITSKQVLDDLLLSFTSDTEVRFILSRHGELYSERVKLESPKPKTYKIVPCESRTAQQDQLIKAWIGSDISTSIQASEKESLQKINV
ncbi:M61 family metallopeptidase, partial [bacterium]|nr:M61 family metallopeptidase [candidate division CSSED10-310 bacterium]